MTDERIKRLNSINFTWDIKRKARKSSTNETVKFDVMYAHLASFKETYGHTKVNKLEKEWKKNISVPAKKIYRRLPRFLAFCRKEQLAYLEGQPCSLDEEKIRMLTELGVEWRKPSHEPRKCTGGEASRKKRKRMDAEVAAHADAHAGAYQYHGENLHEEEDQEDEGDEEEAQEEGGEDSS